MGTLVWELWIGETLWMTDEVRENVDAEFDRLSDLHHEWIDWLVVKPRLVKLTVDSSETPD